MGGYDKSDHIILLFDTYTKESEKLHTSFLMSGCDYPVVCIEDDGFLPENVISVYGYFLGTFEKSDKIPGRPRYFNEIQVPDYWEISGNNTSGKIHDKSHERGRIFYAQPGHKRLVKVVDWLDERGVVRASDHYNRFGALYARTVFNEKGQRVNKSYFSADGKEKIVENYVTKDIILNDGEQILFFQNKTEFALYYLEKTGQTQNTLFYNSLSFPFFVSQRLPENGKKDVLFWQEPVENEIPGNMQIILNGNATRTQQIMVQAREAYDRLLSLGADASILSLRGFVYPFKRENLNRREILICTNSDQIAHLKELIEGLSNMHFHIAAITEMSSKLMQMGNYANVTLYPGVKMYILDELFAKCDYYFDINYGNEIVSAVNRAFLNRQMIVAFQNTIHNKEYIAEEHIFGMDNYVELVQFVNRLSKDKELLQRHLQTQEQWALAEASANSI